MESWIVEIKVNETLEEKRIFADSILDARTKAAYIYDYGVVWNVWQSEKAPGATFQQSA